jgi:hypothetical protein
MHVVVRHRIIDPEKFFSMNAEEVAGGGPAGVHVSENAYFEVDTQLAMGLPEPAAAGA